MKFSKGMVLPNAKKDIQYISNYIDGQIDTTEAVQYLNSFDCIDDGQN